MNERTIECLKLTLDVFYGEHDVAFELVGVKLSMLMTEETMRTNAVMRRRPGKLRVLKVFLVPGVGSPSLPITPLVLNR